MRSWKSGGSYSQISVRDAVWDHSEPACPKAVQGFVWGGCYGLISERTLPIATLVQRRQNSVLAGGQGELDLGCGGCFGMGKKGRVSIWEINMGCWEKRFSENWEVLTRDQRDWDHGEKNLRVNFQKMLRNHQSVDLGLPAETLKYCQIRILFLSVCDLANL